MPKPARQSSHVELVQFDAFGELLRHLRRRAGLTQRDLGQAVGYSEAQITRLERGQRLPDPIMVKGLFIDALDLKHESDMAKQLVTLAEAARHQPNSRVRYSVSESFEPRRTNLPAQLSRFIGRDQELAQCQSLLDTTRLLTLTGPGGVGKSRLAQEVARFSMAFSDGTWLMELAFLTQPEQIADEIAGALGLKMQANRSARDLVCDFIQDRRMLLILDNCEHLVGACAELAHLFLQRCRHLRILATSREVLRASGETVHRVQPLALPPAAISAPTQDISAYKNYSAIELFIHRARAAQHDFDLTLYNAPVIVQVCRRLDGIPLAIELAAAQLKVLSVVQLASQLEQSLHMRLGSNRATLPQHQTLLATLDWSHSLLNDEEQVLFRRLAIFNGSFSLEMVEAVCAGTPFNAAGLLEALINLVDKSLVVPIQVGDDMRYRLLDTIGDYGRAKLIQSGEMSAIRSTFIAWAVAFAETNAAQIKSPEKTHALREVRLAYDNLYAALQWQFAQQPSQALRLCVALAPYWHTAGLWVEGRRCLEEGLRQTTDATTATPSPLCAAALYWLGRIDRRLNDWVLALKHAQESVTAWRALGDEQGLADATMALGWATYSHIGHAEAGACFEEGLVLYRRRQDKRGIAQALLDLSHIIIETVADYDRATRLLNESRQLFRLLGDDEGAALVCTGLAYIATMQGEYARCRDLLLEGLEGFKSIGANGFVAGQYLELGEVHYFLGDYASAEDALQQSLLMHREMGSSGGIARIQHQLARVRRSQGRWLEAKTLLIEALAALQQLQRETMCAHCVAALASITLSQGLLVQAARLLSAAQHHFSSEPALISPADQAELDQFVLSCRTELGVAAFAEAWAAGQMLTLDEACEEALAL